MIAILVTLKSRANGSVFKRYWNGRKFLSHRRTTGISVAERMTEAQLFCSLARKDMVRVAGVNGWEVRMLQFLCLETGRDFPVRGGNSYEFR